MGDAENNFQPSKKRTAQVQLSRDNPGLDDDNDETPDLESGTFKRASDEILATRRIVKVRRPQASSATDAPARPSNPFAAISLAPAVTVQASSVTAKETEHTDKNEVKSGKEADEPKNGPGEVKDAAESAKQPEKEAEDLKTDENASEDSKQRIPESVGEAVEAESKDSEDGAAKDAKVDVSKIEEGNVVGEEKDKVETSAEKNSDSASFGSFKNSSGQNAFSGLTGTGFSSTTFSFGSLSKDGSASTGSTFGLASSFSFAGNSDNGNSPTFSFGGASNNGNSSLFGSSGASIVSKNESKFPPMQEVPLETGEENEKAVFTADSALFEFTDGSWKERGKGELKVNISTAGAGKARLVMRARGNYRLILNASLFPNMKLTNMDKKGITFACINSASEGKEDGLSTIALKFKDPSILEAFRAVVLEHKDKAAASLSTPENSPKA